jgi:chromate transporter
VLVPWSFGGGHVVLPLLQTAVVQSGTVTTADLLAGYGAAQAVPGPLFTFAAYLGALAEGPLGGWLGGLVLLAVIFLPAFLVLVGALPFWEALRHRKAFASFDCWRQHRGGRDPAGCVVQPGVDECDP